MKLLQFALLTIFLSFSTLSFSQSRISVAATPAWVTKNPIDYSRTLLDKFASDGYIDFEDQYSLGDEVEYIRKSRKIISQAGVQNGSEISAYFDPSYQRLYFHQVSIIRNGITIDKLVLSKIKTAQQEEELNNFIYNGRLNAFMILEDVRPGDIIEYSFSKKGFNPVFRNKFCDQFYLNYSVPFYDIHYKIIVPAGRKLQIKNNLHQAEPVISSMNGQQVYEWHAKNVAGIVMQDQVPSWYDPYPSVMISEYNSWQELNEWALKLFPVKKALSPLVISKINEIEKKATRDGQKVQAVLRFVQDDIRYMGIEMGENSHQPADPSKVLAQRFGDCKEKTYLACCMLRAMNIDACPVLINTDSKQQIKQMLPGHFDFDHVTLRVKLDDEYFWYDPTIAYQRGDIKKIFYPDYQVGLVVSDSTTALTEIPFRNVSSVKVKENFKVTSMDEGGTLKVVTEFRGQNADWVRSEFNNSSISELMTNYQKFYSTYFEDIKVDSLNFTDDDDSGLFITNEYYHIPGFWKKDSDYVKTFSFSAFNIYPILQRVKEKERTMPIGLAYPSNLTESITVNLPEEWPVTEDEMHVKNDCFSYNYRFYNVGNIVHMDADYQNLKNHATVEEAPEFFKDLNAFNDFASFQLTGRNNSMAATSSSKKSNNNLPAFIAIAIIGSGIAVWNWRKRIS